MHSRIACFGNGGALPNNNAKIFFSSADWMPRNLNRRVETLIPVDAPTVRSQIMDQIMVANLNVSAHDYFMQNPSLSGRGSSLDVSAPKELDIKKPKAPPKTIEKAVNAK